MPSFFLFGLLTASSPCTFSLLKCRSLLSVFSPLNDLRYKLQVSWIKLIYANVTLKKSHANVFLLIVSQVRLVCVADTALRIGIKELLHVRWNLRPRRLLLFCLFNYPVSLKHPKRVKWCHFPLWPFCLCFMFLFFQVLLFGWTSNNVRAQR